MADTFVRPCAVYLTPYFVATGADPHNVNCLQFCEDDVHYPDWVRVGSAEVAVTLDSPEEYVGAQIAILQAEKAEIERKAREQAEAIEGRIQSLRALPAPKEATSC